MTWGQAGLQESDNKHTGMPVAGLGSAPWPRRPSRVGVPSPGQQSCLSETRCPLFFPWLPTLSSRPKHWQGPGSAVPRLCSSKTHVGNPLQSQRQLGREMDSREVSGVGVK